MKHRRHEVTTGRIGELFAAGIIEEMGWGTAFCQQAGVDLLCWNNNRFYRCQVKASTYHNYYAGKLQFHFGLGGKKRLPTPDDYDFVALVSVPQRKAYFLPITQIKQLTMSRLHSFFEKDDLEIDSFQKTMRNLDEFYRHSGRPANRT